MQACFQGVSALFERCRPASLAELVGQDKIKRQLALLKERRGTLGGRAYWLSGKSGTGKTTLARIIAADVADPSNVEEIDAAQLTAEEIERRRRMLFQRRIGEKDGWALIVNEAHGLRADQVRKLLTLVEPDGGLPSFALFCFTTTKAGQDKLLFEQDDADPLLSRCFRLTLEERGQNQMAAERLVEICRAEGLGDVETAKMLRRVNDHRGNWRAVLQEIEAGEFA